MLGLVICWMFIIAKTCSCVLVNKVFYSDISDKTFMHLFILFYFLTSLTCGDALRYMIPSSCTLGPNCSTRKECQSWYTAHSVEFILPSSNIFWAKIYLKKKKEQHHEHQRQEITDENKLKRRCRVHEFTCHCRWNVHTPVQQRLLLAVTVREAAAAACAYGSYRKMSERCRTSVWGLDTSFATSCRLSAGETTLATGKQKG